MRGNTKFSIHLPTEVRFALQSSQLDLTINVRKPDKTMIMNTIRWWMLEPLYDHNSILRVAG